ncbi:hypothetical protein KVI39_005055 [Salmonella enterica]|nr:hypothetical protein [Salmonella enterica]ELJ2926266.1 hypothetical protein [Salmonella enterica subsp. enterica]EHS2066829.1 hypothetical protein [Salmonella enterica]EHZ5493269.1 hypothetical protein [Salmonella enterica]EJO2326150.1 hypothetical protein [Salmonella enterica]
MTHRVSSSLRCRHCPLAGNGGGAVCGVWGGKEPRQRFNSIVHIFRRRERWWI